MGSATCASGLAHWEKVSVLCAGRTWGCEWGAPSRCPKPTLRECWQASDAPVSTCHRGDGHRGRLARTPTYLISSWQLRDFV